ncbi:MAG: PAS domain S-box protein [Prolixibacteraceae bacterium]|nr:PAS domain S-box protein [Prolixibacteraceae bacterium]
MAGILIVDKDADRINFLTESIRSSLPNVRVNIVSEPQTSKRQAIQLDPDAIILCELEDFTGRVQFCIQIKADARLRDIPVIFLTNNQDTKETRLNALDAGADALLTYPPDEIVIGSILKSMIKLRMGNRSLRISANMVKADVGKKMPINLALKQNRNIIQNLIEYIPQRIFLKDLNSVYILCNENYAKDLGIAPEEIAGKSDFDFHSAELAVKYRNDDEEVIRTGQCKIIDEPYLVNGQERWVHVTKVPYCDETNNISGVLGIFEDISENHRAKEQLLRNEEKYRSIFENVQDVYYEIDIAGNILELSPSIEILSKGLYRRTDLIGKNIDEFYLQRDDRTALLEKLYKSGNVTDYEIPFVNKDGEAIHTSISSKVQMDSQGKPQKIVGTIRDISVRKKMEADLLFSNDMFSKIFSLAPVAISINELTTENNRFIDCNNAFSEQTGYMANEVIESKPSEIVLFTFPEERAEVFRRVAKDGKLSRFEHSYQTKYGETRIGLLSLETFNIGDKTYAITTNFDITDRKKIDVRLEKTYRLFNVISLVNQTIVHLKDKDKLLYEVCRIAVEAGKFRMAWIGLIDKNDLVIKPFVFAGFEDGYLSAIRQITLNNAPEGFGPTGKAIREGRYFTCTDFENDPNVTIWKDEALRRGYRSSISLPIQTFGEIIGAFTLYASTPDFFDQEEIGLLAKVANDISFALETNEMEKLHQKAVTALAENEQKYRKLTENMKDVVWIVDPETMKFLYVSPSVVKQCGFAVEEVMAAPLFETIKNELKVEILALFKKRLSNFIQGEITGDTYFTDEVEQPCKNGTTIISEVVSYFLVNEQTGQIEIHGVTRDITEQKQLLDDLINAKEKAEESDRLKSAFLANMSHEIRTPMNGILGFTELLKEPNLTGNDQQFYIRVIEESGARMLNLMNDIIDISIIESGEIKIRTTSCDVRKKFEYIFDFFSNDAKQKGLTLLINQSLSSNDCLIQTDVPKLEAILINLVKNAIKFTPKGTIEFGCKKLNQSFQFFVRDSGVGIDKAHQELIFDRFRQASESLSRSYEGAGLGLSISKAYVEVLGGTIWVESEIGKGSTFYFTLPDNWEVADRIEDRVPILTDKSMASPSVIKILIAEDNDISMNYMELIAGKFSSKIYKAITGVEAVEIFRANPDINLILMDLKMPVMDGYEATRQIRIMDKEVVIIAQSAYSMVGDNEKAIDAGCTDYINKPISKDELFAKVKYYAGL